MQKLLNLNRFAMYALLVIAVSIPLFMPASCTTIPTLTNSNTQDLYIELMAIPEGGTVFLESDWTVSTRGESAGQLEAFLKIARLKNLKFVLFSGADPQAPQVAKNVIEGLNARFEKNGLKPLEQWNDYVDVGFYPDVEAFWQTVASNPRRVFPGKTAYDPVAKQDRDVYESPVLKNIRKTSDIAMVVNITASGTMDIIVQRMSGKGAKLAGMVTGVMAPEALVYYNSRQIVGLSGGLRGVVEMETMMAKGVNFSEGGKEPFVKAAQFDGVIQPLPASYQPFARGMNYFASLHAALFLLIISVILGNVGLFMSRKKGGK